MPLGDTIVAWASPAGGSARALVRASGPACPGLLQRCFTPAPKGRGAVPSRFALADGLELPVLLLRMVAPASYTGEESFEVLLPGNPELVRRVLDRLTSEPGVRHAGPGEFSARALLNERLTLEQAEGVLALILARRDDELDAARRLLDGRTGDRYRDWSERLATLLALVESGIDFTDQEDVVAIDPATLRERIAGLIGEIEGLAGGAGGREAGREMPRVVLVGAPNAGKSTLFNALLGRRRSVASPTPGTTRDVIEEPLHLEHEGLADAPVLLADLPGLDAPRDGVGRAAQDAARAAIADADLLVWCDPAGRFEAGPVAAPAGARTIRVRTKADLPGAPADAVSICALDGWNLGALRRAIADGVASNAPSALAAVAPRHARSLADALDRLREARRAADTPELVAVALRSALDAFDDLAGRVSPDQVLGRIFSAFCVGK
ncbi:MAG: hypothetical protein FJ255_07400 [Phycisphaerae bacterium]|nr:hypothetical protein [Phycisphaerae bacterium]